jgi:hypothetical protein
MNLGAAEMFFALLAGHAVMDFWAQSDWMATTKNRHNLVARVPPGQLRCTIWPYTLTAHAGMHGLAVAVVTGSLWLGLAETAAHWVIDFGKCENWYSVHEDQGLHILCKLLWFAIAMAPL